MQMKNIEPFKLNIVVTKNEKERVTYAEYSDTFCKKKPKHIQLCIFIEISYSG